MQQIFQNPFEAIFSSLQSIEEKISKLSPPPPQQPTTQIEERFLDVKETAQLFGVSTVSIWSWEKAEIIKSYRIGNLKRFKYSELLNCPKLIVRK